MLRSSENPLYTIESHDLIEILINGRKLLEANVDAVNALNVFPVPDGDTGTNMLLTMRALEIPGSKSNENTDPGLISGIARDVLMGARGNSGVILAQFFQGFAKGLGNKQAYDCEDLIRGISQGSAAAYTAVGNPVEGTMLTVIREISEIANEKSDTTKNIVDLWETITEVAGQSVDRTPALLPVLAEAGVVDAGGLGLLLLLEGARQSLLGENDEGAKVMEGRSGLGSSAHPGVKATFLDATEHDAYGYCTQFLIEGQNLNIELVRLEIQNYGTSTVVIGDAELLNVHAHSEDPGSILTYAVSLGSLSQVNISSMDEQHREFVSARRGDQEEKAVGVLAVSSGPGLSNIFLESGASAVLSGGDTMNPSVEEICASIESISAESVIVLPNNSNIIAAAEQACLLARKNCGVVPTKSVPQGFAAILAFNQEIDWPGNLEAMTLSLGSVESGGVTIAVRGVELGGVKVNEGEFIGILEGQLVLSGYDSGLVLRDLITYVAPEKGSLVTIYWGSDTREEQAAVESEAIAGIFPEIEVEVLYGGQPHYNYLVSIE
jgi:DAK2 domain fusion protein YloV